MSSARLKAILYGIGKLLGMFGIGFVIYKLFHDFTLHRFIRHLSDIFPLLPFLLLLNIVSGLLGIRAWHRLLLVLGESKLQFKDAFYYFARTEIAKYLPGNIFHFLGRQAFASNLGHTQTSMAKVSFLFTVGIAVATLIASASCTLFAQNVPSIAIIALLLAALGSTVVFLLFFPSIKPIEKIYIVVLLSFSILFQGIMAVLLVHENSPLSFSQGATVAGIYVLSWLIGFATPGASGGLGVRETAFLAMTSHIQLSFDTQAMLMAIIIVRFVNIVTDMLFYGFSFMIKTRPVLKHNDTDLSKGL